MHRATLVLLLTLTLLASGDGEDSKEMAPPPKLLQATEMVKRVAVDENAAEPAKKDSPMKKAIGAAVSEASDAAPKTKSTAVGLAETASENSEAAPPKRKSSDPVEAKKDIVEEASDPAPKKERKSEPVEAKKVIAEAVSEASDAAPKAKSTAKKVLAETASENSEAAPKRKSSDPVEAKKVIAEAVSDAAPTTKSTAKKVLGETASENSEAAPPKRKSAEAVEAKKADSEVNEVTPKKKLVDAVAVAEAASDPAPKKERESEPVEAKKVIAQAVSEASDATPKAKSTSKGLAETASENSEAAAPKRKSPEAVKAKAEVAAEEGSDPAPKKERKSEPVEAKELIAEAVSEASDAAPKAKSTAKKVLGETAKETSDAAPTKRKSAEAVEAKKVVPETVSEASDTASKKKSAVAEAENDAQEPSLKRKKIDAGESSGTSTRPAADVGAPPKLPLVVSPPSESDKDAPAAKQESGPSKQQPGKDEKNADVKPPVPAAIDEPLVLPPPPPLQGNDAKQSASLANAVDNQPDVPLKQQPLGDAQPLHSELHPPPVSLDGLVKPPYLTNSHSPKGDYFNDGVSEPLFIFQVVVGSIFGVVIAVLLAKGADAAGITRDTFLEKLPGAGIGVKILRGLVVCVAVAFNVLVFLFDALLACCTCCCRSKQKRVAPTAPSHLVEGGSHNKEVTGWDQWEDETTTEQQHGSANSAVVALGPSVPTIGSGHKKGATKGFKK